LSEAGHIPVLLEATLATLAPEPGQTYLDCTAGLGGHAAAIAPVLGPGGVCILNDADPGNLALAAARLGTAGPRVVSFQGNFAEAPRKLEADGISADLVLADLGFSSNQVEEAERGMSFSRDGPLDMRLDPNLRSTAADLVASLPVDELTRIIREYGEDRAAYRIAQKLVEARRQGPISTTRQLAEIVRRVSGRKPGAIDPATRTFQALRIAVNDELGSLDSLLRSVEQGAERVAAGRPGWLKPGARVAIISFHSLEDRPVKRVMAGLIDRGLASSLTRRPIEADEREVSANPRSRSAKLRAVRIGGPD
jgi:16S rRNA (cytosine1402-N4)-methyltransferase